jgi:hypothetical protein
MPRISIFHGAAIVAEVCYQMAMSWESDLLRESCVRRHRKRGIPYTVYGCCLGAPGLSFFIIYARGMGRIFELSERCATACATGR